MSSLLLSQSIISSTENSLREKSLQRIANHLNPNQPNLRQQLIASGVIIEQQPKAQEVSKFCGLIFISILVLLFYLFIFSLVALIGYILIIWVPYDIERNKLNNELYHSITNQSNILLFGQLPQYERTILITKDLFVFESKTEDALMNLATKPSLLQARYPALFWNEDFRLTLIQNGTRGAVWVDRYGEWILVFVAPVNASTVQMVEFKPSTNQIRTSMKSFGEENQWLMPLSSQQPGLELQMVQTTNGFFKIMIGQFKDIVNSSTFCIGNHSGSSGQITVKDQYQMEIKDLKCGNQSDQWSFFAGFDNGSKVHLFTDHNQVLITDRNLYHAKHQTYDYELVPIEQFINNGLMPVIADYIILGVGIFLLVILTGTVIKYLIFNHQRFKDDRSDDYNNNSETQPLIYGQNEHREPWSPKLFLNRKQCRNLIQNDGRKSSAHPSISSKSSRQRQRSPGEAGQKNYEAI